MTVPVVNPVDPFVRYLLERYIGRGQTMLDVGCGPAPYRSLVAGRYIGLDNTDEPYFAGAERRADIVAAADKIPLADGSVELIFCKSAFFLVPDPAAALIEFRRVLVERGRVLILDYNRRAQRQLQAKEGIARPCWTQWQLRDLVAQADFRDPEILVPKSRDVRGPERWLRLVHQELFGTWAIVTGIK
jgi:ubiquinone/menaquinone biosynthesis C-methylase UbiE